MKYTKNLAGLGIIVFGLVIAIFFAGFIGEVLGKAAKADSAKIKMEQNIQHDETQSVSDRLARVKQEDEASYAANNITYFYDSRTNICFAYLNVYDAYGSSRSITTVNCVLVPEKLLIVVRK